MMDRRTFVAGAATFLAAPCFAWAQDTKKRRIAVTHIRLPFEQLTEAGGLPRHVSFYQSLRERGYIVGENLIVDLWSGPQQPGWTGSKSDLDQFARDIVASAPEVILVMNGGAFGPTIMRQTKTIPIVFMAQDPIRVGLVTNLAHPGGNLTGTAGDTGREIDSKSMQFLVEAVPSARRIAYVAPRRTWEIAEPFVRDAASALGVTLVPVMLDEPIDEAAVHRAFAALADNRVEAYVRGPGQHSAQLQLFADLALERRLPAIAPTPDFARLGGFMSYAPNAGEASRTSGEYLARILDGEYPGDLPVQQPTVFEFVINLKTAKALGITLPPALMIQATEFIE